MVRHARHSRRYIATTVLLRHQQVFSRPPATTNRGRRTFNGRPTRTRNTSKASTRSGLSPPVASHASTFATNRSRQTPHAPPMDASFAPPYRSISSVNGCLYELCVFLQSGIWSTVPNTGPNCRQTIRTNLAIHPKSDRRPATQRGRKTYPGYPDRGLPDPR
jgi:hypothetical protein